jgi:hypothetical protein
MWCLVPYCTVQVSSFVFNRTYYFPKFLSILDLSTFGFVGRLVVVIDVNPSHGFWTARLMKVFGHEGKCT